MYDSERQIAIIKVIIIITIYNSDAREQVEIVPYLLEREEKTAAIIVCPGGGYRFLAEHESEPVAKWLNSIGLSAFVLRYRVTHRHPAPLDDGRRAVRYLRAHAQKFSVDPARIGMLGFSAGGHLTASVGVHWDLGRPTDPDPVERFSSRPDCLVLCYPVISFVDYGHSGSMVSLLGKDPTQELRQMLSLQLQVTEQTPPAFLWHTATDASVPVQNTILFAKALADYHVEHELHVFPQGGHGLGLASGTRVGVWTGLCRNWLWERGFVQGDS